MKVSVVIPILDSHEIVRRQLLYLNRLGLPDDVEFIFVDDGSDPPLTGEMRNLRWIYTNDKRPWTIPLARKHGVMESSGEKLLFTDIDHILTEELIHHVRATNYDIVYFKREAAVLDENGKLTQDHKILREYGLTEKWFERNLDLGAHGSSYAIKRDIYFKLGGQDENAIMIHPNRENVKLRYRIRKAITNSEIYASPVFPMIYCIPNGHFCGDRNYNPKNLFHSLKRNTVYS